jgi:hypothetical protein
LIGSRFALWQGSNAGEKYQPPASGRRLAIDFVRLLVPIIC